MIYCNEIEQTLFSPLPHNLTRCHHEGAFFVYQQHDGDHRGDQDYDVDVDDREKEEQQQEEYPHLYRCHSELCEDSVLPTSLIVVPQEHSSWDSCSSNGSNSVKALFRRPSHDANEEEGSASSALSSPLSFCSSSNNNNHPRLFLLKGSLLPQHATSNKRVEDWFFCKTTAASHDDHGIEKLPQEHSWLSTSSSSSSTTTCSTSTGSNNKNSTSAGAGVLCFLSSSSSWNEDG